MEDIIKAFMVDLKKLAAEKAIELIGEDTKLLGLGAGVTISHIVDGLTEKIKRGSEIKILTSSLATKKLLIEKGIPVEETAAYSRIDLYLDGCDQFDKNLDALKSGGGIHTLEKLLASMANEFVIVADESKFVEHLDNRLPIVVELIPQSLEYVKASIERLFPGVNISLRMNPGKILPHLTENANWLLDCWFDKLPELKTFNPTIKNTAGVLETSLFYGLAKRAVVAGLDATKVIGRFDYEHSKIAQ
ncbi:MAG TPA: ribose 5-phosphate isomerase A [Puia sp.]|nr:ribose 5-phosphate isomerase A [Puia sp.]